MVSIPSWLRIFYFYLHFESFAGFCCVLPGVFGKKGVVPLRWCAWHLHLVDQPPILRVEAVSVTPSHSRLWPPSTWKESVSTGFLEKIGHLHLLLDRSRKIFRKSRAGNIYIMTPVVLIEAQPLGLPRFGNTSPAPLPSLQKSSPEIQGTLGQDASYRGILWKVSAEIEISTSFPSWEKDFTHQL